MIFFDTGCLFLVAGYSLLAAHFLSLDSRFLLLEGAGESSNKKPVSSDKTHQ